MAAIDPNTKLWGQYIPYTIQDKHPNREAIVKALNQIASVTGIKFIVRQHNQPNYLNIVSASSGSSHSDFGKKSGSTTVTIRQNAVALHEIMHAVGFMHEHCRSDRDDFVNVKWGNIDPGRNDDFTKVSGTENLTDYDWKSVTHYPAPAKGWGGNPSDRELWTMTWKEDGWFSRRLGPTSWEELSEMDKEGLRAKYSFPDRKFTKLQSMLHVMMS